MTLLPLLLAACAAAAPEAAAPMPRAVAQRVEVRAVALVPVAVLPPAAQLPKIQAPTAGVLPRMGQWAATASILPNTAFDGALRPKEPQASDPVSGGGAPSGPSGLAPFKPRKSYAFAARVAAASALSMAALAPVVQGEAPPTALVYALAAAWTLAAGAELAYGAGRLAARLIRGKSAPAPERRPVWQRTLHAAGAVAVGLGLGAGIGSAPHGVKGPVVEGAAAVLAPEKAAKAAGTEFSQAALERFARNPASAKTAERLRGLSPAPLFVAAHSDLSLRYEPRLHAFLVHPRELASRGWTPPEFAASPALQRRLAAELEAEAARELFRMAQANGNPLYDGANLDGGPIEAEREALLFEHDYVHALLKADPRAPIGAEALARYELMLGDFARGLAAHDGLPEVSRRGYWNAGHYKALFMHRKFDWPEHAYEGYSLLARRASTSTERRKFLNLASDLYVTEGLRP